MFKPNLPPPPEKTVFPKPKEKTSDQPMDQEVMGAMEKEKAPKDTGDMNPIDIIRTELEAQKSKVSAEKMYMALVKLSKTPSIRILRANNSMMVLNNKMDGTGEGQVFIADKPEKMVETFKQFHDALVKAGLKKVSFTTTRPAILKILKSAGLNFTSSRGQARVDGGVSPAIKVEVLA